MILNLRIDIADWLVYPDRSFSCQNNLIYASFMLFGGGLVHKTSDQAKISCLRSNKPLCDAYGL